MKLSFTGELMGNRQALFAGNGLRNASAGTPVPTPMPPPPRNPNLPIAAGADAVCPKGYVMITSTNILGQVVRRCVPKSIYSTPAPTPVPTPTPMPIPGTTTSRFFSADGDNFFQTHRSSW